MKTRFDRKKGLNFKDAREIPTYSIPEAAHYLRLPTSTLRSWVIGRNYSTPGKKRFAPLISIADRKAALLSFQNLVEAHVLSACRRKHNISMSDMRRALDFVSKKLGSDRPLLDAQFETDGVSLFVEALGGELVDAGKSGQLVMREFVEQHLQRLEREDDLVARFYPFTRPDFEDSPRSVFIDPRLSFGRPVLASAGVATISIAERYSAGESISELAADYDCDRLDVEEALRCEFRSGAAA